MAPTAALRPEWFTAIIMEVSNSSPPAMQAYTAPASTWAALSQWSFSITSQVARLTSFSMDTASRRRVVSSLHWAGYWQANWAFIIWTVSSTSCFRGSWGAHRLRLMMWARAAPERKARGPPWVRATVSAPSRSSSGCFIRSGWKKRPTPMAVVRLPGVMKLFTGVSGVPRFSRPRVSSIRVSMQ